MDNDNEKGYTPYDITDIKLTLILTGPSMFLFVMLGISNEDGKEVQWVGKWVFETDLGGMDLQTTVAAILIGLGFNVEADFYTDDEPEHVINYEKMADQTSKSAEQVLRTLNLPDSLPRQRLRFPKDMHL